MEPLADDPARDGVYGDVEGLAQSCQAGTEQEQYMLRKTKALAWLSRYSGPTETGPREPEPLEDLEPEASGGPIE